MFFLRLFVFSYCNYGIRADLGAACATYAGRRILAFSRSIPFDIWGLGKTQDLFWTDRNAEFTTLAFVLLKS